MLSPLFTHTILSSVFRKSKLHRTIAHLRKMFSLLTWIGLSTVIAVAQPYFSMDTPPSCYEINAHARNGMNDFEGALYTPATPAIGQPGGAKYKMNPTGKPVWNNEGNQYGDVHAFLFSYTPSTGTAVWNIDFNRDGDFLDYKESVSSSVPALVGKGFQYVNVLGQGNTYGMTLTLSNFTINGVDFGTFVSTTNTPFTHLFEDTSGLFGDLVVTGNFSFSGAGSNERPRLWIQLGESNIAPTCTITSPTNGMVFNRGDTMLITATASDPTGKIMRVEFFDGDTKIGEDHTFPYSFTWVNIPAGTRTLRAKAIDNHQAFTYSTPVSIPVRCIREDLNIDGVVSTIDFLLFLSVYGKECMTVCAEDFNDDAVVSALDFLRILAVFGYTCL